jgi:hypothetical protein
MIEGDWVQVILKALIAVAALAGAIAAIFRWLRHRARAPVEATRLEAENPRTTNITVKAKGNVNVVSESYNTGNGNKNAWK